MATSGRRGRTRQFEVNKASVTTLLLADHSDSEEDDLDEEDVRFLSEDSERQGTDDASIFVAIDDGDVIEDPNVGGTSNQGNNLRVKKRAKKRTTEENNMAWSKDIVPVATQNADTYVEWGAIKIDTISQSSEPVEVFRAVSEMDKLVQSIIVPQSNLYALQNGRVFETYNDEIMAFLGINFLMGYHVLPSLDDYWSNEADICVPFVLECMPRDRFREIRKNLHFADNSTELPRDNPDRDRAFKIRPLISHFNESFAKSMENTECQSVDEHMVKFKGRNAMKQYMKNKPIKWGFKMWARCCSKTGYLFQFDYYTG